jgi:hypothetical protein
MIELRDRKIVPIVHTKVAIRPCPHCCISDTLMLNLCTICIVSDTEQALVDASSARCKSGDTCSRLTAGSSHQQPRGSVFDFCLLLTRPPSFPLNRKLEDQGYRARLSTSRHSEWQNKMAARGRRTAAHCCIESRLFVGHDTKRETKRPLSRHGRAYNLGKTRSMDDMADGRSRIGASRSYPMGRVGWFLICPGSASTGSTRCLLSRWIIRERLGARKARARAGKDRETRSGDIEFLEKQQEAKRQRGLARGKMANAGETVRR